MKQAKKILIVDDEPDAVTFLEERLRLEGYETIEASEGVRAIELAHKNQPDLILLDIRMPAGTGQTVLHALRKHPDTKTIPVVVITGVDEEGLEKKILSAGAQGFFRKPYDPETLLAMIRALLSVKIG